MSPNSSSKFPSAPTATVEQDEIVTDALYRERTIDVSPWVAYPSRIIQSLLPLLLFYPYVDWRWLAGWEAMWLTNLGVVAVIAGVYRRRYPLPHRPHSQSRWRWVRVGCQTYGWLVTGLVPLFCFQVNSESWEIAAAAGTVMILVFAPYDASERHEVATAGVAMPLPLLVMLLVRGAPLHFALAMLTAGVSVMLTLWGMKQLDSTRKEFLLRLVLQDEKNRAEQANIAKSRFLAAASHDLRQPLHALGLFVAALNERVRNAEARLLVRNINRSVEALEGLFNALLDISKLDAGVVQPVIRHVSLDALLLRLGTEYLPQARAKGLLFEYRRSGLVVQTDSLLLETILRNLISNAIRYTETGSVFIICEGHNETATLAVVDTGPGIAPEHQTEIFREFYQLHNPERDRTKGLGLGLAIVDRLAKLLNHPLELRSVPGRGSTFRLSLPVGEAGAIQIDEPVSENLGRHAVPLNVLLIDDEATVCEAMAILLDGWSYGVTTAGSLEEALALLRNPPDVIIADYRLREERTGAEAIRALQQHFRRDIPALIVTGDTDPERIAQAKQSGFAFLHKPVSPAKLRAFLRGVRGKSESVPASKSTSP
jgi:two-component system, sensor histidine kinase